jgi:hypothetical protein
LARSGLLRVALGAEVGPLDELKGARGLIGIYDLPVELTLGLARFLKLIEAGKNPIGVFDLF